jgi:photosystem II stability/assembly factor-like uncharacterized protein
MPPLVLVGTRKGLFLLHGDDGRKSWRAEGPLLTGWQVFHAIRDPRDDMLYAATNSAFFGGTVQRSRDRGRTWERAELPSLPEESGLELAEIWHVEPGGDGELWLGATPGVLFRSDDGGETWEPNRALLEHPTRERWQPGAGGMCCHSIQVDREDPKRLAIAISAAGSFFSDDGGESWEPRNSAVAADFMPDDPYPEVGQCVHKLLQHPARPDRFWQQNHCGVYRSDDRGVTWVRLDGNGLPSDFGFPIALDPSDPDAAWVLPEESAGNRVTSDGRLGAYRTRDGGASWELASGGLPDPAWAAVMREGMSFDDEAIYFGTQAGSVYVSVDGGDSWLEAAAQLPQVLSVEAAAWP